MKNFSFLKKLTTTFSLYSFRMLNECCGPHYLMSFHFLELERYCPSCQGGPKKK